MKANEVTNPQGEILAVRVPEAARRLGLSVAQTYLMVSRGELPSFRVGRAILLPVKRLERYVADQADGV